MTEKQLRSDCPINYGLEMFGDKWSLLIVRDLLFYNKKTYGEFLKSQEGIATNILAQRLLTLEEKGFITKSADLSDRRKDTYLPTQKMLDTLPMLLELAKWSIKYGEDLTAPQHVIERIDTDRGQLIKEMLGDIRKGKAMAAWANEPGK